VLRLSIKSKKLVQRPPQGFCRQLITFLIFLVSFSSCVTPETGLSESKSSEAPGQLDQTALRRRLEEENADLIHHFRAIKITKPFLWKIEGYGHQSYLFGTIHAGTTIDDLPYIVLKKFRDSDTIVLEADLQAAPKAIAAHRSTKPLDCLDQQLSKSEWQRLQYDLQPYPSEFYRCFPPAMIQVIYMQTKLMTLLPPTKAMDEEFDRKAKKSPKERAFLETPEEAFAAINELQFSGPPPLQILKETLNRSTYETIAPEYKKIFELGMAYKSHQLETLAKMIADDDVNIYPVIIKKRNHKWLPKLVDILRRRNAFVAVGVGHMTGPSSLISLLESEGFQISQTEI
jgi:uncharacterized protein